MTVITVNSSMFAHVAWINVCVFETKLCSQRLIFAVSLGLVNYPDTHELCLGVHMVQYLFLRLKDSHEFRQINPSQTVMNLQ